MSILVEVDRWESYEIGSHVHKDTAPNTRIVALRSDDCFVMECKLYLGDNLVFEQRLVNYYPFGDSGNLEHVPTEADMFWRLIGYIQQFHSEFPIPWRPD